MNKFVKIGEAAKILGVSVNTLRRWEEQGFILPGHTPAGTRFYLVKDLEAFKRRGHLAPISSRQEWLFKIGTLLMLGLTLTVLVSQLIIIKYLAGLRETEKPMLTFELKPKLTLPIEQDLAVVPVQNLEIRAETSPDIKKRLTEVKMKNQTIAKQLSALQSSIFTLNQLVTTNPFPPENSIYIDKKNSEFYYLGKIFKIE